MSITHRRREMRSIVLQLLDHPAPLSRADLGVTLSDIEPLAISDALSSLAAEGVVILAGEMVEASRCARCIDRIGLICI